jgi:membrane-bound lytic murein transglycosylase F
MRIANVLIILTALLGTSLSLYTPGTAPAEFNSIQFQNFEKHANSRLPAYERHFKRYGEQYNIPWTLLAAVAYQESKWDNSAVSHTGVRGLMQITEQTAEHIGIVDRRNPVESIRGGAFYLRYLYEKTPKHLLTSQRWVLALAGYNIGWGHVRDAYRLGAKLKLNANYWDNMQVLLPLLEEKEYYSELIYGYARGNETVDFVENVFTYFNFMNQRYNPGTALAKL